MALGPAPWAVEIWYDAPAPAVQVNSVSSDAQDLLFKLRTLHGKQNVLQHELMASKVMIMLQSVHCAVPNSETILSSFS